MQIKCPNCNKSFNVNDNMIPSKGRLLQCGSCSNKWFYKKKEIKTFSTQKSINTLSDKKLDEKKHFDYEDNTIIENKDTQIHKKSKFNYINLFFVFIISFISLVVLLDTFKSQISNFFPFINIILDNLYETIKDITLFFKDLIR